MQATSMASVMGPMVRHPILVAPSKTISFKEVKIYGDKGDIATIPFIFNKWCIHPDATRVVPTTIFFEKVIGEGIVEKDKFLQDMEPLTTRLSTNSEEHWLKEHGYIAPTTTSIPLVPTPKMVAYMKELNPIRLASTIVSMEDIHMGLEGQAGGLFPDHIPPCTLDQDAIHSDYSIPATHKELEKKGALWKRQMDAMAKWKKDPPLSSHGHVHPLQGTSLEMLKRSMEEYGGFVINHLARKPTMDLVMEPSTFSQFMAFKQARGNAPSTLLKAAQLASQVVPFVMSGKCPQAQTWGPGHAAQVQEWYSNLRAHFRAQLPTPPSYSDPSTLAMVWDAIEAEYMCFLDALEVSD